MARIPRPAALLALALVACGAPADAPPASAPPAAPSISTHDTVVRGLVEIDSRPPYDTTDWLAATEKADPDSVVAGRVPGVVVVDSVFLGTRGGARVTALLVRLGPERQPRDGYHRVYEVQSSESGRAARATELQVLGKVPAGPAGFGAVDLDGDGVREPYVGHWTGGTQGFTAEVSLLDLRRHAPHGYMLEGFYGDLESRRGELQGDRPPPSAVRRWMTAHVQRVADHADPRARDPVMLHHYADVRQWGRDHGTDLLRGPVRVRWHAGPVPALWQGDCLTRYGDPEWVMAGGIWGYDPARGRHFLLRPFDRYSSPHGIVPGARYLWLGTTVPTGNGHGLLAYERSSARMTVVPVPELAPASPWCREHVCGGPSLSVRAGRLYGDSIPLTLPDSISPHAEFADTARACPRTANRP